MSTIIGTSARSQPGRTFNMAGRLANVGVRTRAVRKLGRVFGYAFIALLVRLRHLLALRLKPPQVRRAPLIRASFPKAYRPHV